MDSQEIVEEDPIELMEEEPQYHPLSDDDDDSPDVGVGVVVSSPDIPPPEGGDDRHSLSNGFH